MAIRGEDLNPGHCSSLDQYESSVPGGLPNTKGQEKRQNSRMLEALSPWITAVLSSLLGTNNLYVHSRDEVSIRMVGKGNRGSES
jgi:hypothetical protein